MPSEQLVYPYYTGTNIPGSGFNTTCTVTNGSATVTGQFTIWETAIDKGDVLFVGGNMGLVLDRVSDTELTLTGPWAGESAEAAPYAVYRNNSYTDPRNYGRRLAEYLTKLRGIPDDIDAFLAQLEALRDDIDADAAQVAADKAAAETAASTATGAATTATDAAASAQGSLEAIQAINYGALPADPITRPDGSPIQEGDQYVRTTAPKGLRVYLDGSWTVAAMDANGALVAANNLSDVPDKAAALINMGAVATVTDRSELAALNIASHSIVFLAETGLAGLFEWIAGDRSAEVGIDTLQGIFVAPASDPSGESGVWMRVFSGAYNIAWFGAAAGGDCSPALQCAINLARDHDSIYIPGGVYRPASTVTAVKNRLTIFGDGNGSYLWLANGANCDLLKIGDNTTYIEHVTVRGLSFDGNRSNNIQGDGVVVNGVGHFKLTGCVVQEIAGRGMNVDGIFPQQISGFPWVTDNFFGGINGDCIRFGQQVYGGMISNNAIRDGGAGGAGAGVYMFNNMENMIVGNQFDECEVAVNVQSSERITVTGNFVENTHTHGVVFQGGSLDSVITGNIVSGSSKSQPNVGDGIVLANSQRIAVSGNRVLSEWGMGTGISETGSSDFNSITGNLISGAARSIARVGPHTTVQAEGVVFEATVTGTNVTGDGTVYRINSGWAVVRDTANSFNGTNGVFTVPITGTYQFDFTLILTGMAAGHTKAITFFRRNPASPIFYNAWSGNVWDSQDNASQTVVQGSLNVYLNADDFIELDIAVYGGAKTISLASTSRFTGRLVG
jgi:hypothetical protein